VTGLEGDAQAVLIRAAEPLNFSEKCSGPGLLTKKLGIDKSYHKNNIFNNNKIKIIDNTKQNEKGDLLDENYHDLSSLNINNKREGDKNFEIVSSFRIGVRKDLDRPLRFYIKGNRCVSRS